jgi:hypothetical protein
VGVTFVGQLASEWSTWLANEKQIVALVGRKQGLKFLRTDKV